MAECPLWKPQRRETEPAGVVAAVAAVAVADEARRDAFGTVRFNRTCSTN